MLVQESRAAAHETLETLHESDEGSLVVARTGEGEDVLLFVPANAAIGALERERLTLLAGPGVPPPRPHAGGVGEAIVLEGAAGARPLRLAPPLPDTVWRPGLTRLLSTLSQAHGLGLVHGRLAKGFVLADAAGLFWIHGWAGARPAVGRGPFHGGLDDVASDVRDLGIALLRQFADPLADELAASAIPAAVARVAAFDRELARVLARLVTADPREAYESATEILTDLGEHDQSLPDPWFALPLVGRARVVRNVLAHAGRASTPEAYLGSYEIVGPPGSGRTRVLAEIAREARAQGLTVLQVSGGAPDHPWGAIGALARQLVSRIPADHPLRAERGVRALLGDHSPGTARHEPGAADGASVALSDLLAEALRGTKGVVLLDDEDALAGHALRVWRGLGRHVATAAGSSQAIPVLLVSASSQGAPEELGTPRERAELADLTPRQVTHVVASILIERGHATILAAELLAIAGGRPGEIVDHLREMVSRGALVQVGRRFHVQDAAQTVRAGSCADRLRRATEAAGRDGVALAEVIAAGGRLRLPREAVAEIAEISGPRLHAAAEAALRAGLIARDGTTWRPRTESVRARLESAMPDDRRRGLHREILARLLDAREPDWPAIAAHGRAAGDPRAAEWTRSALHVLRTTGRFHEAAAHFDDARVVLDPAALDTELRLVQVDTLLNAGRLDDATRCAEDITRDPLATPLQRGQAVLALARLHRYDQSWSKVLALELPVDAADPVLLARIRLVRAIAHVFRGRIDLADREERLARAEVERATPTHDILFLHPEYRYYRAQSLGDHLTARTTALGLARAARAQRDYHEYALALARYANALRLNDECGPARRVLARARDVARLHLSDSALVLTWITGGEAYIAQYEGHVRRMATLGETAATYAARTGALSLALNLKIRNARFQCGTPRIPRATLEFARQLARDIDTVSADTLALAADTLAFLLLFTGVQAPLDALFTRLSRTDVSRPTRVLATQWWVVSRLSLGLTVDPPDFATPHTQRRLSSLSEACADRYVGILGPLETDRSAARVNVCNTALIASAVRDGLRGTPEWPESWTDDYIAENLDASDALSVVRQDLAFSMLLEHPRSVDPRAWEHFRECAGNCRMPLPLSMEWRRTLAYACIHWHAARFVTARRLAAEARRQVAILVHANPGATGVAIGAYATRIIDRAHLELPVIRFPVADTHCSTSLSQPRRDETPLLARWRPDIATCIAGHGGIVIAEHSRELEVFMALLVTEAGDGATWVGPSAPRSSRLGQGTLVCILTPGMEARDAAEALHLQRLGGSFTRVVVGSTRDLARLRACGDEVRTLLERCEGAVVALPRALADPEYRRLYTRHLLGAELPGAQIDRALEDELTAYNWPGGLAEFEAVARKLLEVNGGPSVQALWDSGWCARSTTTAAGIAADALDHVLTAVSATTWVASGAIARAASTPLRTTVRALGILVRRGCVERMGRGPATRYRRPEMSAGL